MMKAESHGFHSFREVADRDNVVVYDVLARPGISSPQIHIRLEDVVDSSSNLIVIRRNAYGGGVVPDQARQVGSRYVGRCEKCGSGAVPTLLRNLHVGP